MFLPPTSGKKAKANIKASKDKQMGRIKIPLLLFSPRETKVFFSRWDAGERPTDTVLPCASIWASCFSMTLNKHFHPPLNPLQPQNGVASDPPVLQSW